MGTTHLVISDQHASPDFDTDIPELIGKLIVDLKPDVIINIGDAADMASLNSYDSGKKAFVGKSYSADIDAHCNYQERMFAALRRQKKKRPRTVFLEGNHENRISKAINLEPHLEGRNGLSFNHLLLDVYYDEIVRYANGNPGITRIDGISYAHYMVSGVKGLPISGEHHAYSLLMKNYSSCTVGHSHTADWAVRNCLDGRTIMGAVVGTLQEYTPTWAGGSDKYWYRGLMVAKDVENGCYDPSFISINRLRKEYKR